jgi:hypothetical protein
MPFFEKASPAGSTSVWASRLGVSRKFFGQLK